MEDVDAASKVVQRRAAKSLYQGNQPEKTQTITTTTVTKHPSTKPSSGGAATTSLREEDSTVGPPMLLPQRSHSAFTARKSAAAAGEAGEGENDEADNGEMEEVVAIEERIVVVEGSNDKGSDSGSVGPSKKV